MRTRVGRGVGGREAGSQVWCVLQMTSRLEGDLAPSFPELQAHESMAAWRVRIGGRRWRCRGAMWRCEGATWGPPASGGIAGSGGECAAPGSSPRSAPRSALGGARLLGGGERVHEGVGPWWRWGWRAACACQG